MSGDRCSFNNFGPVYPQLTASAPGYQSFGMPVNQRFSSSRFSNSPSNSKPPPASAFVNFHSIHRPSHFGHLAHEQQHGGGRPSTNRPPLVGSPPIRPFNNSSASRPNMRPRAHSSTVSNHRRTGSNSSSGSGMMGQFSIGQGANNGGGSVMTQYDQMFTTIKSLVRLLEYYFSNQNVWKDTLLLAEMNKNELNFVSLESIMHNNDKIREVSNGDIELLLAAVKQSNKLQLSEDCNACRRITPLPFYDDHTADAQRSIYVEGLPNLSTVKSTKQLFKRFGKVTFVLRANEEGDVSSTEVDETFTSAFIQFEKIQFAKRALNAIVAFNQKVATNNTNNSNVTHAPAEQKTTTTSESKRASVISVFDGNLSDASEDDDAQTQPQKTAQQGYSAQKPETQRVKSQLRASSPEFIPMAAQPHLSIKPPIHPITTQSAPEPASIPPEDMDLSQDFIGMKVIPKSVWLKRIKAVVNAHFAEEDELARRMSAIRQNYNWRDPAAAAAFGGAVMSPLVRAIAMKSPALAADVASLTQLTSPGVHPMPSPQINTNIYNAVSQQTVSPVTRQNRAISTASQISDLDIGDHAKDQGDFVEEDFASSRKQKRRNRKPKKGQQSQAARSSPVMTQTQQLPQTQHMSQNPHMISQAPQQVDISTFAKQVRSPAIQPAQSIGTLPSLNSVNLPSQQSDTSQPYSPRGAKGRPTLAKQQSTNPTAQLFTQANRYAAGPPSENAKGFTRNRTVM